MKSMVLFNNKGGVGKTTLTFNIAHMFARQEFRTVVLDCDPQCDVSTIFLNEDRLFELWTDSSKNKDRTVADCLDLVRKGRGEVLPPTLTPISQNLWLLPGHLELSRFEQPLAEEWPKKADVNNERALDVTTALDMLSLLAAKAVSADIVMIDVGPSLGALNRSALLACDFVVLPLAPDLFSLQGLKNVGPSLMEWRSAWEKVRVDDMEGRSQQTLPPHDFKPIGYIVQQHLARADRPVAAYARWASQIPVVYHESVLGEKNTHANMMTVENDPHCIASIKHFASLVPIAQVARKPLFDLKQADGIGGGQIQAVAKCREEFNALAIELARRMGLKKKTS